MGTEIAEVSDVYQAGFAVWVARSARAAAVGTRGGKNIQFPARAQGGSVT